MNIQYITVFDQGFAHHGLALYRSLRRQHPDARLAVIAMDARCEAILAALACEGITIIPVEQVLDDRLRTSRTERTLEEFCWTLSPVAMQTALVLAGPEGRAVYLDADMWVRGRTDALLAAMDADEAELQIVEHGFYGPTARHWERKVGRFCVQWVVARDGAVSRRLLAWWRERCTEWCFRRFAPGRFGDQKYLDAWPGMAEGRLSILPADTIGAPWNMGRMTQTPAWDPPCFHFHTFRAIADGWRWVRGYRFPAAMGGWYAAYQQELEDAMALIRTADAGWSPTTADPHGIWQHVRAIVRRLTGYEQRRPARTGFHG